VQRWSFAGLERGFAPKKERPGMKKIQLEYDQQKGLVIDAEKLNAAGLVAAGKPVLLSLSSCSVLLSDEAVEDQPPTLACTGGVLDTATLAGVINNGMKSGILAFICEGYEKRVFFTRGEVVYATSTQKEDRLGNTLWRNGMITLDALNEVSAQVGKGGARLGELLMRYGKLKPRDIYVGLTLQVKEIFVSTFSISEGYMVFREFDHGEKNSVRLREPTAELIREGLRQHGELRNLRTFVPGKDTRFRVCEVPSSAKLNSQESAVIKLAGDGRTFEEIVNDSRLGEYGALKAVERMMQVGYIVPAGKGEYGIGESEQRVDQLINALALCWRELKAKGPMGTIHLESYLENPPAYEDLLGGVIFDPAGTLDRNTLLERAVRRYGAQAGDRLTEALDEMLQYATFEVKNALKPGDATNVIKAVVSLYEGV
jgi:hypothetical protein